MMTSGRERVLIGKMNCELLRFWQHSSLKVSHGCMSICFVFILSHIHTYTLHMFFCTLFHIKKSKGYRSIQYTSIHVIYTLVHVQQIISRQKHVKQLMSLRRQEGLEIERRLTFNYIPSYLLFKTMCMFIFSYINIK